MSTENEYSENIIEFISSDKGPLSIIKNPIGHCFHAFELDLQLRIVTCRTCKSNFDSLDALVYFYRFYERYSINLKRVKKELSEKYELLTNLKKEITNEKNKLNRIKKGNQNEML